MEEENIQLGESHCLQEGSREESRLEQQENSVKNPWNTDFPFALETQGTTRPICFFPLTGMPPSFSDW